MYNELNTQQEIRDAFWEAHPEYQPERRARKKHNDYNTDICVAFSDFVDFLWKDRQISLALCNRVTL